ncbi:hypothetical protein Btru_071847 [Bulinus truncatus]|nr:hypothetical protein Btru_071847 [Bulinus truncatus]
MASVRRGKLKPNDEACIRQNYEFLKEELEAEKLIYKLYAVYVLDENDIETIRAGKTRSDKNDRFLRILLHAGPGDSYNLFLDSLEKQFSHVREQLLQSPSTGNGSVSTPPPSASSSSSSQLTTDASGQHILISYCDSDKELVHKVHKSLEAKGYDLWIDTDKMGGNLMDSMAHAVENSWLVLLFISQKYKDSKNCRFVAEYAFKRNKELIIVKAQPRYEPDGWLGLLLGLMLDYDFGSSTTTYDQILQNLIKAIENVKKTQRQKS